MMKKLCSFQWAERRCDMKRTEKKILWYCVSTGNYDVFPVGVNPNNNRDATGLTWVQA